MAPYRAHVLENEDPAERGWFDDDRVLGIALLLIGALRVVLTLAERASFASEFTIALFMIAVAVRLLFRRRR